MKKKCFIVSVVCLFANLFLIWGIGTIGLQEHLTLLIYFLPLAADLFIIFINFRQQTRNVITSLLIQLVLFLLFLIVSCFGLHFIDTSISSILALCVFMSVFNIFPLIAIIVIMLCIFKKQKVKKQK